MLHRLSETLISRRNADPTTSYTAQLFANGPDSILKKIGEECAELIMAGKEGNKAFYGFPFKTDLKSLVWYSPENFEDAGYEVPKSMEELKALTEKIVADGGTPWCIGIGSGGATGWPATDWVEDMMLRTQTPEDYDAWVKNDLKFDDPKVIEAIEEFGYFARNDDYVAGGSGAVVATDFRDSPKGLFASPPQCYLHHQASFIPSFFPEGTVIGQDADFFYFPAYAGKDLGQPVLGAGTIFRNGSESVITGITTAASLLMVAVIGIAVGVHSYVLAVGATALTLAVLVALGWLERRRDAAGDDPSSQS
mgnify:CR=1 FL=1